jgi:hypothetical protein
MRIITHDADGFRIEQGSDAWKKLRVGLFTGTGIGDLLAGSRGGYGKGREDQIDEVVTEMLTGLPSGGFFTSKYIRDGIEREPMARMAYEEITGNVIEEVAFIQHDWMRAGMSPDGLVMGRKRNIEIKAPKDRTHYRYFITNECPEEYRVQVAVQQWLGGFEATDFVSYHPDFRPNMRLVIREIPRDEKLIAQIEVEVMKAHAEVNVRVKHALEVASAREALGLVLN